MKKEKFAFFLNIIINKPTAVFIRNFLCFINKLRFLVKEVESLVVGVWRWEKERN